MNKYRQIVRFFFVVAALFTAVKCSAQWEQVGWPGGAINILLQEDHTVLGICGNSYYRSGDDGVTWKAFNNGLPTTSFLHKSIAFVDNGMIRFSYNFTIGDGKTYAFYAGSIFFCHKEDTAWSHIDITPINKEYPRPTSVFLFTTDSIFATTLAENDHIDSNHGCYVSFNGGQSWVRRMNGLPVNGRNITTWHLHNRLFYKAVYFDSLQQTYIAGSYFSDDFGEQWHEAMLEDPEYNIMFRNDLTWIAEKIENGMPVMYWSSDNGKLWNRGFTPWLADSSLYTLHWIKEVHSTLFLVGEVPKTSFSSACYYSNDLGKSWHLIPWSIAPSFPSGYPFGGDNFFCVGVPGKGYYKTDTTFLSGAPIENFPKGQYSTGQILFTSGTRIFASSFIGNYAYYRDSTFDSITVSFDNGTSWTRKEFSSNYFVQAVEPWYSGEGKIYTTGKNKFTLSYDIISSSDDGDSWQKECIVPSTHTVAPKIIIGDTLVVQEKVDLKTQLTLFTINKGQHWDTVFFPILDHLIGEPILIFSDNKYLNVFQYSQPAFNEQIVSIFESDDICYSWNNKTEGSAIKLTGKLCNGYRFGNRYFITSSTDANKYDSEYQYHYTPNLGANWLTPNGLTSKFDYTPSFTNDGRLYSIKNLPYGVSSKYDEGRVAIYTSTDSGSTWFQLGDYVTDANEVYAGSDYIYAAGPNELWRYPKSQLSVRKKPIPTTQIVIESCYPNPATDEMNITYSVPSRGEVTLKAYDITGIERGKLIDRVDAAGSNTITWDTKSLPSGTYILRLNANGESISKVVQIIK